VILALLRDVDLMTLLVRIYKSVEAFKRGAETEPIIIVLHKPAVRIRVTFEKIR
jgi:hypothetical protein